MSQIKVITSYNVNLFHSFAVGIRVKYNLAVDEGNLSGIQEFHHLQVQPAW